MSLKTKIILLTAISFFIYNESSFAQIPPQPPSTKAGVEEKLIRKEAPKLEYQKKPEPVVVIDIPKEEYSLPEGKKIRVNGFIVEGNTVVYGKALQKALKKYKYRELSMKDLRDAAGAVDAAYKKKGYFLARTIIPPQDVKNNMITLKVIEGRLGSVTVEKGKFYGARFIRKNFNPTYKGIINYNRMVKSLLILNGYSDLTVDATLQKGAVPQTVDIVLKAKDKFPFHAGFDYNNFGSRYISNSRFGFSAEYNSVMLEGDKLYAREVLGSPVEATQFTDASYMIPINNIGTRLGFEYVWNNFEVQREYKAFRSRGYSRIYTVNATHPISKTLTSSMNAELAFDYKDIQDFMLNWRRSNDQIRLLRATVNGDWLDNFKGRNFYTTTFGWGLGNMFNGSDRYSETTSHPGYGDDFFKVDLDIGRYQKFIWGTYILAKGSAQFASEPLLVPEQMALGGADSVRGYPEAEFLGDYGYQGTVELRVPPPFVSKWKDPLTRRPLGDIVQLLWFLDGGQVYNKKPMAPTQKANYLIGTGFGVRINAYQGWDVRLDVGFPIGGNEPSDNSSATTYIQAICRF